MCVCVCKTSYTDMDRAQMLVAIFGALKGKSPAPKGQIIIENKATNSNPLQMCLMIHCQTTTEQAKFSPSLFYRALTVRGSIMLACLAWSPKGPF